MATDTLAERSASPFDHFNKADVRQQLFDIRALGNSLYGLLDCEIDQETQADAYRMVRMIVERTEGAIEHINEAESAVMAH